ncbi:MAG: family 78 glycoside hydrolase catalytic domain [Armatimonadetes bacterium]|nr:family 78 glycoside hydrolase catalytic domain [Armatimonadota bacterium]
MQSWDQDDEATGWSEPAYFAIGLNQEDWQAQWIHGAKPISTPEPISDANWIWTKGGDPKNFHAGTHTFSREFTAILGDVARITLTADNLYTLIVNGAEIHKTSDPEAWNRVRTFDISSHIKEGRNRIEIIATNATPGYAGVIAAITVANQTYITDGSWSADGEAVQVLGKNGMEPWKKVLTYPFVTAPAQYFRTKFAPQKPIKRAVAYVTALGNVDFTINGERVSNDLFTPGWTDYRIRTYYRAFDVTDNLKSGENELGAVLGQGWFAGYVAWGAQREHWGDTPMFKAQVEVEYEDGSRETVATNATWQVSDGPILDEHFLHGEKYDARIKPSNWKAAQIGEYKTSLEAFTGNPVQEYAALPPKSVKKIGEKKYLIDFGQNLSGYTRIHVNEPAGTKITIRHGERLDAEGNLYTANLRLAQAIDQYICAGGDETWNPRFTFHGFQYVEVVGLSKKPTGETIQAIAISSATPEVGVMETSDQMLNQLLSNCWWTQKMNFVDVPTDCPQRDERLGWTGDAQAYVETAAYFSDVQAFFDKWLVTLDDAQREDGQYPQVAPVLKGLGDGGPAWSDAGVICPMEIYDAYGDKELLRRHYPNMKRFIEFCRARSKDSLLPLDNYHIFGDWLSINANTPKDVITTAYFAGSTELLAEAAEILGYEDDAKHYHDLHQRIRKAFQQSFVSADGKVSGDTQCGYVLAIGFDLLEPGQADLAAKHLIENIESRNWHLSTGFVGTRDIMHVLTKIGRSDVAFRLLHNTDYPSWGFPIQHGATSIWERWDGWMPEKGFQDVGMNSFAHYAYGAVAGWMFKTIGGISPLEAGYGKISIAPQIDPNLEFAKTTYDSVRGPIRTHWWRDGDSVRMTVEIPANTTAVVVLPDGSGTRHEVGSGSYEFSWRG